MLPPEYYDIIDNVYGDYPHKTIRSLNDLIRQYINESYLEDYSVKVHETSYDKTVNVYIETGTIEEYIHVKIIGLPNGIIVIFKMRTPTEMDSSIDVYFVNEDGSIDYYGSLN